MSSIPEDLYLLILIRVPVRSTFACKCVCKSWLDLISSPMFVKMHLDFNIQNKNHNLMFRRANILQSVSYDSLSVAAMNDSEEGVVEMDYPFKSVDRHHLSLKGSCAGLVCFSVSDSASLLEQILCLWNPATNEYKKLPKSDAPYENSYIYKYLLLSDLICTTYALGYDYKTDDHKLVKIVDKTRTGGMDSSVCVYTLGSNSWKCIQSIPFDFILGQVSGEIVSGAFHWLGGTSTNSKAIIISLDISDERFGELQLPEELIRKDGLSTSAGKWEECLCLLVNADNDMQFDVWVMKEYGVHESWSKHLSITLKPVLTGSFLRLMWSFKNGKILLMIGGCLALYDPDNLSPGETYTRCLTPLVEAENYIESLVSLGSGTYLGR